MSAPPVDTLRRPFQRSFERLHLPGQVLLLALAAGGATLLLAQALSPAAGQESWAWMLACTLATAAAAWWPAQRARRAHEALAGAARQLAQEGADDSAQLPHAHPSDDLDRSTLALRRLVELWRARRQELEARNALLGTQLQARTHELSTLQDLSIGLNKHTEMGALVGEIPDELRVACISDSGRLGAGRRGHDARVALCVAQPRAAVVGADLGLCGGALERRGEELQPPPRSPLRPGRIGSALAGVSEARRRGGALRGALFGGWSSVQSMCVVGRWLAPLAPRASRTRRASSSTCGGRTIVWCVPGTTWTVMGAPQKRAQSKSPTEGPPAPGSRDRSRVSEPCRNLGL